LNDLNSTNTTTTLTNNINELYKVNKDATRFSPFYFNSNDSNDECNTLDITQMNNSFEAYTQNIILQVQLKSAAASSIPLVIRVCTPRWSRDSQRSNNVLRLIGKLLQHFDSFQIMTNKRYNRLCLLNNNENDSMLSKMIQDTVDWKELEFDYENKLTVRLYASPSSSSLTNETDCKPISVRIMKFKKKVTNFSNKKT
jgi:hypothetical protein